MQHNSHPRFQEPDRITVLFANHVLALPVGLLEISINALHDDAAIYPTRSSEAAMTENLERSR